MVNNLEISQMIEMHKTDDIVADMRYIIETARRNRASARHLSCTAGYPVLSNGKRSSCSRNRNAVQSSYVYGTFRREYAAEQ